MSSAELALSITSGSSFLMHFVGVGFSSNNAFEGEIIVSIKIGTDQLIIDSRPLVGPSGSIDYFYQFDTPISLEANNEIIVETTTMKGSTVTAKLFCSKSELV